VRFADIAPPLHEEEEAAGHAHYADTAVEDVKSGGEDGSSGGEEASPRSAAGLRSAATRIEDVRALRVKLETLLRESGLKVDLNLEIF
jgi:hypothetical protein